MTKKRVLIVNEFSQLATGFSTYMSYVLPRLHATGKFEIAEHACYVDKNHPYIEEVPWKVYPNESDPQNPEEKKLYSMDRTNQFGKWKFEQICLDFKPDIVITLRDNWMDFWINKSPYRKYFKYITMPTVDGYPQKSEWLDDYRQCDKVLAYSYFGKKVLEYQSGGQIKVDAVATGGTDPKVFCPMNKKEIRESFGMKDDIFIVGTVMRNQPRKLFPEIMKAFRLYLDKCKENGRNDLAQKTYLYFHTSSPDVGWNLAYEMKQYGVSHKILFTYWCSTCGSINAQFYQGDRCVCQRCKNLTCQMPNTGQGVPREHLAKIMNLFDLYMQYSVCEGQGLPINDSKGCGVPTMVVDYSAMSEQARNGGGIPVKYKFYKEPLNQTNQMRAIPDNDDCAEKLFQFFSNTQENRDKLGREARECVTRWYNWDNVAKIWENVLDNTKTLNPKDSWLSPVKIINPPTQIPNNLNNEQFVVWCHNTFIQEPQNSHGEQAQRWIQALNVGYEIGQDEDGRSIRMPVDRNKILQHLWQYVQNKNALEQYRYDSLTAQKENNKKPLAFVIA